MLELFGELAAPRSREIVEIMDADERKYGSCALDRMGEFDEGKGCLNYGKDGRKYKGKDGAETRGETILKIFVWVRTLH